LPEQNNATSILPSPGSVCVVAEEKGRG